MLWKPHPTTRTPFSRASMLQQTKKNYSCEDMLDIVPEVAPTDEAERDALLKQSAEVLAPEILYTTELLQTFVLYIKVRNVFVALGATHTARRGRVVYGLAPT